MHLLIGALPNLHDLRFCTTSHYESSDPENTYRGLLPLIPSTWIDKPTILRSLRKLLVGSPDLPRHITYPQAYMPYLRLPNLRTLLLFGITHNEHEYDGSTIMGEEQRQEAFSNHMQIVKQDVTSNGSSPIRHVEHRYCKLTWRPVCTIVGVSKAHCTFIMHSHSDGVYPYFHTCYKPWSCMRQR